MSTCVVRDVLEVKVRLLQLEYFAAEDGNLLNSSHAATSPIQRGPVDCLHLFCQEIAFLKATVKILDHAVPRRRNVVSKTESWIFCQGDKSDAHIYGQQSLQPILVT